MPEPTLFISHKHSDNKIAQALATFCEERSNGRVTVYLSSNPDFKGPKIGKDVCAQLRQALWHADVLMLIYTSSDQDWSWCMWECGVANDSQSPETNIIVFQCGSDYPAPFNDVLRVNVRNPEEIKRFVNQFLRDADFFPSLKSALAPNLRDTLVESAAKQLYDKIASVLPPPDNGLSEEWPTWPYLRIELPRPEVDKMEQASEAERVALSHQLVKDFGTVVASDSRAAPLFGLATFPNRPKLNSLLRTWKEKNQNAEATWFDSCCEQIMMGAARGFPVIRWTPIREADGESDYTPVLSRIKTMPYGGTVQFDIYFYNLSDPRAVLYNDLMKFSLPGKLEERYRWDRFTLSISSNMIQEVRECNKTARSETSKADKAKSTTASEKALDILQNNAQVVDPFGQALLHFGYTAGATGLTLGMLTARWRTVAGAGDPQGWIQELCEEMNRSIEDRPSQPSWELMKSARYPEWWFYPILNHVRLKPDESLEFDVYLYRAPGALPAMQA